MLSFDSVPLLALLLVVLAAPGAAADAVPPPKPAKADMLVGAYYFPGWSKVDRWYCIAASDQAVHPLLGYYREGDPDAADWHIKWALEHGVGFFSFDFYTADGSQMLESALDEGFLKSRYIDKFKFCLNWCNHAPYTTMTARQLRDFGDLVIHKYLTHPSYLRIDGKPVVMILVGNGFVRNLGVEGAKAAFDDFEARCRRAGLPGVYLVFCEGEIGSEEDVRNAKAAGADAFCRYNFPYAGTGINGPGTHAVFPYSRLVKAGEDEWSHWRDITGGDFWPTVMPGWDRRPWTKHDDVMYENPTPDLFGQALRQARESVNKDRIVMIEAWNEWGEGSVLEPSVEHRFGFLDQVREVFCPNAGKHTDTDPESLGMRQPVYDLELPSHDCWKFDFDTDGWAAKGLSGVHTEWGALVGESTDDDPQLTSPATYLDCADYSRLYVRMKASAASGDAKSSRGQIFWSTIDYAMSGERCASFVVQLDGEWHEYDVDLAASSGWRGRTDRLRLDPVAAASVKIEIDEIGLVKTHGVEDAEGMVKLSSGKLDLEFSTASDRLSLVGINGGGRNWLCAPGGQESVWKIAFSGDASVDVGSAYVKLTNVRQAEGNVEFDWDVPLGDSRAVVTMAVRSGEDGMSYWSLRAKLPDGWKVVRADFPLIPNLAPADNLKMAAPTGWGLEYDVKPGMGYGATYPSLSAAMQFVAFYEGGHGLYIGAHDPQGNHKYFNVTATDSRAAYLCTNWPAVPRTGGGTYEVPFEAAVGVFAGGYYEAAQIYREFTFSAPWGRGGPVSRRHIPKWLTDTELWLMPDPTPVENVDACVKAAQYFGAPLSLHWYNWHQIPFDTLYPDYFPAKPDFEEGVKAFHDAGLHVMPYINGRLCDPNSKAWTQEGADMWAARKDDGEPYTEVYGSKVPLNVMCPYTSYWQDKVSALVDRLTNECGVDGVYIDQICAASAERCFNASHGHPIGGGHSWVDGYRKLLAESRSKLPKDRILTTEENTECWIDLFDALLLVNTPTTGQKVIPLFPAVYSGRTITFGFQYIAQDDLQRSLPFRAKMARAFVWGSQLGWVGAGRMMAPEAAGDAEFLRNLSRCRRFGHDYLLYGRFLGMFDAYGDNPHVKGEGSGSFGGTYRIDMPSVLASAWKSEDGRLGIAIANMSDDEHEVEVRLPLREAGIGPDRVVDVEVFGPDGKIETGTCETGMWKIEVPGLSGALVSVKGHAL